MEAVANGQQAYRFSSELHIGEVYAFRGLGFETAEIPPQFGQTIPTNYYVVLHYRTQINRVGPNISIPRLPSRFMDFRDVARLKNNMLTGAYTREENQTESNITQQKHAGASTSTCLPLVHSSIFPKIYVTPSLKATQQQVLSAYSLQADMLPC
jgi:hypothetical protein